MSEVGSEMGLTKQRIKLKTKFRLNYLEMEELINEISGHLSTYFQARHLTFLAKHIQLILLMLCFVIVPLFWNIIKYFKKGFQKLILSLKLHPFFDYSEIVGATEYFIETKFQNIDPTNEQELSFNQAFTARSELIPFFIREVFNEKNTKKYFFVLADSGMGKTTLFINLFYRYVKKISFNKFKINLFPLGSPTVNYDINGITKEDQKNTILLLDAFDEDARALPDFSKRLHEILEITTNFKKVIISCRTQYFSSLEDEPYETGLFKFGGKKGKHYFHKVYLSPFDNKDIKRYLNKKYSFLQKKKKKKAKQIVLQCPNLMIRPMLLGYIDDLVNHDKPFQFTYQVYNILISKWIDREASRYDGNKRQIFWEELYNFSKSIALQIYENQKKNWRSLLRT